MPLETVDAVIGADFSREFTLYGDSGLAVAGYLDTDTLAAHAVAGAGQAEAFAPSVSWEDAAAARLNYAHTADQTAGLDPGRYPMLLSITRGSSTITEPLFLLNLVQGVGTGTLPTAYCSFPDLLDWSGNLLENLGEAADLAGFADERGKARDWTDRTIISRADSLLGYYRSGTLGLASNWVDRIVDADNSLTDWDAAEARDLFLEDLQAILDGDTDDPPTGLIVDDTIREANALYALSLIYGRQLGKMIGDSKTGGMSYSDLASEWRQRAIRKLAACTFRVDSTGDGTAILVLEP